MKETEAKQIELGLIKALVKKTNERHLIQIHKRWANRPRAAIAQVFAILKKEKTKSHDKGCPSP